MSEPDTRADVLEALRALAEAAPGMRMGQLMAAAGELCADLHGRGLWDAEDQELLEAIWKFQHDLERSLPAEVNPKA